MKGENDLKKRIVPDWLNLKHEYLFKIIGKKGKYARASMAVWPLDFQTTLRFSITSLLPIITVGITISMP